MPVALIINFIIFIAAVITKWLESIRSNQITSVIKESVCEAYNKLTHTRHSHGRISKNIKSTIVSFHKVDFNFKKIF